MDADKFFERILNNPNRAFEAEAMSLSLRGRVKSKKEALKKAQLALAVEGGELETLRKLLAGGASPNDPAFDDCLLTRAIWRGKNEVVLELLKASANPNVAEGCPPLLQAVSQFNLDAARMLLEAGADPNVSQPGEQPALLLASLGRAKEMVELLLAHKAKTALCGTVYVTERRVVRRVTPLMGAADVGSPVTVTMLLAAGADPTAKDSEGCTALDWAGRSRAKKAREQIMETLRKAGGTPGDGAAPPLLLPPDFRTAARTDGYKRIVRELSRITGIKARRLQSEEGPIHGGYAYEMEVSRVKDLVAELQHRFLSADAFLFATTGQPGSPVGDALAVLPTTDPLQVVAAIGTAGPNSCVDTQQIVEWLRDLGNEQRFQLIGVGGDFVEGRFLGAVKNALILARRITELCPDAEGAAAVWGYARHLEETRVFHLWWD